jgi:hypothetical protein
MAFLNPRNGELQLKIVYAGPGRGGKTTNMEFLHRQLRSRIKTDLVTINTYGRRTLFFDFCPIEIGKIRGHNVRVLLYSTPGQSKYNVNNRLIFKGVDGIVYVADSQVSRREKNVNSMTTLQKNLAFHGQDIAEIPLVFQYNKRDLSQSGVPLLSIDRLEKDLNHDLRARSVEASALVGHNVLKTLKLIVSLTFKSAQDQFLRKWDEVPLAQTG